MLRSMVKKAAVAMALIVGKRVASKIVRKLAEKVAKPAEPVPPTPGSGE